MFSPIAFSEASTAPQVRVVGGPGPLFPQKLARTAGQGGGWAWWGTFCFL